MLQEDPLETLGNLYLMVVMFFLTISHRKWVWGIGFCFGKISGVVTNHLSLLSLGYSLFLPFLMLSFQIFFLSNGDNDLNWDFGFRRGLNNRETKELSSLMQLLNSLP